LIDDLIERGLDPAVPRLFIIDGSKALAKRLIPLTQVPLDVVSERSDWPDREADTDGEGAVACGIPEVVFR